MDIFHLEDPLPSASWKEKYSENQRVRITSTVQHSLSILIDLLLYLAQNIFLAGSFLPSYFYLAVPCYFATTLSSSHLNYVCFYRFISFMVVCGRLIRLLTSKISFLCAGESSYSLHRSCRKDHWINSESTTYKSCHPSHGTLTSWPLFRACHLAGFKVAHYAEEHVFLISTVLYFAGTGCRLCL